MWGGLLLFPLARKWWQTSSDSSSAIDCIELFHLEGHL